MKPVYFQNNAETHKLYEAFFNQKGSGYNSQGYIYNSQVGAGLGGFFRSLLKVALPIGKKALYKGLEIAKPELKAIAKTSVNAVSRLAEEKIKTGSRKAQRKLNSVARKKQRFNPIARKADVLS